MSQHTDPSNKECSRAFASALLQLGQGLLEHPDNTALRAQLHEGSLDGEAFAQQLLSVVLRWCVVLTASSTGRLWEVDAVNHTSKGEQEAKRAPAFPFATGFSADGNWEAHRWWLCAFDATNQAVEAQDCPRLYGDLWCLQIAMPDVLETSLDDACFQAVAATLERGLQGVDTASISQALGASFAQILGRHPHWDRVTQVFTLADELGSARKSSGSYYTPPALVDALLDQALEPILQERLAREEPSKALMALRICDPSCGAGHFLVAAAQRLFDAIQGIAGVKRGDAAEASTMQAIVTTCVYGVDLQPWAISLCRLQLWLLAAAPLSLWSTLSRNIRCGNSLFGASSEVLAQELSPDIYLPIGTDDAAFVSTLRQDAKASIASSKQTPTKPPKKARKTTKPKPKPASASQISLPLAESARNRPMDASSWDDPLLADAWCAAFVCDKQAGLPLITPQDWQMLRQGKCTSQRRRALETLVQEWQQRFRWLHWEHVFPDVFCDQTHPSGFDLIIGNPPWERIKLQEKEYFSGRIPTIANAKRASTRRDMIEALADEDPAMYQGLQQARRLSEGLAHFVRQSGLYPMSKRGDINLYTCFIELSQRLLAADGTVGLIVPSGIATDHTTQAYFRQMIATKSLLSLSDLENTERFFPDVSSRFRFCLLLLGGAAHPRPAPASFLFFARQLDELQSEERRFQLTAEQLAMLNPNTHTCPIFRSRRDALLTLSVYEQFPILWHDELPEPPLRFLRMFDMTNDSALFLTEAEIADAAELPGKEDLPLSHYLPLYEGKMFEPFDHRFADVVTTQNTARPGQPSPLTVEEHQETSRFATPQYWVPAGEVTRVLEGSWDARWLLVFKDVTSPTNSRTFLATILPLSGVSNSAPLLLLQEPDARLAACLCANINSFMLDYLARQKISSLHMNFFIVKQLPFVPFSCFLEPCPWEAGLSLQDWLLERVLRLVYTADDMVSFAEDCGYRGGPFLWDEEERLRLRCELDAAFFLLYQRNLDEVGYVLDSFPIIRRRDERSYGVYKTKELILSLCEEWS